MSKESASLALFSYFKLTPNYLKVDQKEKYSQYPAQ